MRPRRNRCVVLLAIAVWLLWGVAWLRLDDGDAERRLAEANAARRTPATPRVVFVVAQTRPSPGWCQMVASAILSNVTVVTVGHGEKYAHTRRVFWVAQYIEAAGLRDEDVVVSYDGADTLLTGALTVQRAVERFIATTAPSFENFAPEAVQRAEATAPLLFTAESNCYHPQLTGSVKWGLSKGRCISAYKRVEGFLLRQKNALVGDRRNRLHFLNAGGYVARVWALKQAFMSYRALIRLKKLWCDQSAWGMLYLWSISRDASVSPTVRVPFGLIGLDFHNSFFLSLHGISLGRSIRLFSPSAIEEVVVEGKLPFPPFFEIRGVPRATPVVLHFNGIGRGGVGLREKLRNHTSWFVEAHRTEAALLKAKEGLQSDARVILHGIGGKGKEVRYSDVCRVGASL
ncbi:expression site-associated gene (ESAG-like) protein [Trypanosoma conorhini]|uniref:Expression site-associated gene (ESAG-like) protein n=1 Tax=Trypanosoma conorhini TaxID=83891 RepID=A0A3R7LUI0_9TRYP|nr:expression site-associated gene (ESAG-like) protein [Trypanosoma conorhini]RNF03563.1 expression site-associated gene (ESAG-like) protein [Trypanosoma conorhini]